ncbi:MAG: hypothetical protein GQ564_00575 [Bacteroidales bacterium]|nr:hypothetical protein [Bacteroidales bacterium]
MCTVTYIPPKHNKGFILTSNRDEKAVRPTIPLAKYEIEGIQVCFPKDKKAGGSWIAANNHGRLCCLLNGAFIVHKKQSFHVKSRGNILVEITATNEEIIDYFQNKNLSEVEPFTLVALEHTNGKPQILYECIWDGEQKHVSELDSQLPKIWSSVTLYSNEDRKLRKLWFDKFLVENKKQISPESVYNFHSGSHSSDQSVNLLMQREGGLKTVSITQVVPDKNKFNLKYTDLLGSTIHQSEI